MDSENRQKLNVVTKKTKGRQKTEIKRISNENNLRVTFSKRRSGVFKKASELATLCGVDLAVIMFSPSNRVFSFGNPTVDSVIQRYTTQGPPPLLTMDLNEAYSTMDEGELNRHLNCLSDKIDAKKKHIEYLNCLLKTKQDQSWWATPIENMNDAQRHMFKKILQESKRRLKEKCGN